MQQPSQRRIPALVVALLAAEAEPVFAQGYSVGGSRPSRADKFKLHAELAAREDSSNVALPKLGLAWAANPKLELGVDFQFKHLDSGLERVSGLGDAEVKAKTLLLDADRNAARINVSAEFKLALPLGDARRGFGEGRPVIKLPVTASRREGPWEFGGLIGVQHAFRGKRTSFSGGALITRELDARVKIGTEIVTEWRTGRRRPDEVMANVGLRYAPSRKSEIFFIAGQSLATWDRAPLRRLKAGIEIVLD